MCMDATYTPKDSAAGGHRLDRFTRTSPSTPPLPTGVLADGTTMTEPQFAIVIPIHNEAGFVGPCLTQITSEVSLVARDYRIILVENGSTDDTFEEATAAASADERITVLRSPEPNYGLAMRYGMESVTSEDWIVVFDIDYFSGPFVAKVVDAADTADVVIASKRAPGSVDNRAFVRRLATRVFNQILRSAVGSKVSDTHGIKAFRRSTAAQLLPDVQLTQDLFDTEMVIRAERAGFRIVEVPIVVEELREARSSLIKRIPRTLRGIQRLRTTLRGER